MRIDTERTARRARCTAHISRLYHLWIGRKEDRQGSDFCRHRTDLNEALNKFCTQEEILPSSRLTSDEQECEEHFRTTHLQDTTGRYIVRLPFRSDCGKLGDSRSAAA